ncbi:hypothetical protein HDU92_009138, partial [Lobulomyces angularis]
MLLAEVIKFSNEILIEFEDIGNIFSVNHFETEQELYTSINDNSKDCTQPRKYHLNVSDQIFTIIPQLNYKDQKHLRKFVESDSNLQCCVEYKFWESAENQFQANLSDFLEKEIKDSLEQKMRFYKSEAISNQKEIERWKGKPVLFGQIIQFQQKNSKKFLSSVSKTFKNDHKKMEAVLTGKLSKNCWFKILPRYKSKSEGDVIHANDKVILKNMKNGYLYCGKTVQNNEWRLKFHSGWEENYLAISNHVVRFYNDESESYLACCHIAKTLGLKKYNYNPARPKESEDCSIYWVIVDPLNECRVVSYEWKKPYRLMNLLNGKYLCYEKKLALKSHFEISNEKDSSLFLLHPGLNVSADNKINIHSKLRFQHYLTKKFLCLDHGNFDFSQLKLNKVKSAEENSVFSTGVSEEKKIKFQDEINESDLGNNFSISIVDKHVIESFYYINSFRPAIKHLLANCKHGKKIVLESKETEIQILSYINKLILYCTISENLNIFVRIGNPNYLHQQIVRTSGLIDDLIGFLSIPQSQIDDMIKFPQNYLDLTNILKYIYRFLYVLLKSDINGNGLMIYQHFPHIQLHIGLDVGASKVLSELILGSRVVVEEINNKEIARFIRLMSDSVTAQNASQIKFLTYLCYCQDQPVPRVQHIVTKKFIQKHSEDSYIYRTRISSSDPERVEICVEGNWLELVEFILNKSEENIPRIELFYCFLELYEAVSKGQNFAIIKILTDEMKLITARECELCLKNEKMPYKFRILYSNIVKTIFIDSIEDSAISVNMIIPYNEINTDRVFSTAVNDNKQDDTKKIHPEITIKDHVTSKSEIHHLQNKKNSQMSRFAYLISWINVFLNEKIDLNDSHENIIGKNYLTLSVLKILKAILPLDFYKEEDDIKDLLHPLLNILDRKHNGFINHDVETGLLLKTNALEVLDQIFAVRLKKRVQKVVAIWKLESQTDYKTFNSYDLNLKLTELAKSDDINLRRNSFLLLNRAHSNYVELSRACKNTVIIKTPLALAAEKQIAAFSSRLKTLPKIYISAEQEVVILAVLVDLSRLCRKVVETNDTEMEVPNKTNQKIILNFEIHNQIFEFINGLTDSNTSGTPDQTRRKILHSCSEVLRLFCLNNDAVKNLLWKNMENIFPILEFPECCGFIIEMISSLESCLRIEPKQIAMLTYFFKQQFDIRYIELFKKLSYFNDISIKRNSRIIIKELSKADLLDFESFIYDLQNENPHVSYKEKFFGILDVLSTTCKGKNKYINSSVQATVGYQTLIDMIARNQFTFEEKKIMLDLLTFAWLKDKQLSNLNYLDYMPILNYLNKYLRFFPKISNKLCKDSTFFLKSIIPFVSILSNTLQFVPSDLMQLISICFQILPNFVLFLDDNIIIQMEQLMFKFSGNFGSNEQENFKNLKLQLKAKDLNQNDTDEKDIISLNLPLQNEEEIELNNNFQEFLTSQLSKAENATKAEYLNYLKLFYDEENGTTKMIEKNSSARMLIKHLDSISSLRNQRGSDSTAVQGFSVLSGLIETEILKNPGDSGSILVNHLQNTLTDIGGLQLALKYASSDISAYRILGLKFLGNLLILGNSTVQNTLMNHFLNVKDEPFFYVANVSLSSSIELLSERKSASNQTWTEFLNDTFIETSLIISDIQLMCEGQFTVMKNYLRDQKDNLKSFNILGKIIEYLNQLSFMPLKYSEPSLHQTFDTVTELLQGNKENQLHVYDSKVIQTIIVIVKQIHQLTPEELTNNEQIVDLQSKATNTLLNVVLGSFFDPHVFQELSDGINWFFILDVMENVAKLHEIRNIDGFKKVGIDLFMFYSILEEYLPWNAKTCFLASPAFNAIKNEVGRIEVLLNIESEKSELLYVYFRIPEAAKKLTEVEKKNFVKNADRSSPTAKLMDFKITSERLIHRIDHV